jgi:hypothetical protein
MYDLIRVSDITGAGCAPTTSDFGTSITCTVTFTPGVSGTVKFETTPNFGGCTTGPIQPTETTKSCSFVPSNTGNAAVVAVPSGGTDTKPAGSLLVNPTDITPSDPILATCPKAGLGDVLVNSTTTCTVELPIGKTIPSNFMLGIGDANPNGICTIVAFTRIATCTGVPTGSMLGIQKIYAKIGIGEKYDSGETANVVGRFPRPEDINVNCSNPDGSRVKTDSFTTCTFVLPPGVVLDPGTKFGIDGAVPGGVCTLTNPQTAVVTCVNVPVGPQPFIQPIYVLFPGGVKTETGEYVDVENTRGFKKIVICKGGEYNNGDDECSVCPAGYYCTGGKDPENRIKTPCPKGSYCPAGSPSPTPCPVGKTTAGTGAKSVAECNLDVNQNTEDPNKNKNPCPAGYGPITDAIDGKLKCYPISMKINDPYVCGGDIFGNLEGTVTSIDFVEVVLTNNLTGVKRIIRPALNDKNEYLISRDILTNGDFTVSYSLYRGDMVIASGSPYAASIRKSSECPNTGGKGGNRTVRTGGDNIYTLISLFNATALTLIVYLAIAYVQKGSKVFGGEWR